MQSTPGHRTPSGQSEDGAARFVRLSARDSSTAALLHRCPVVSARGEKIGIVDHLIADALTHQPRYVVLAHKRRSAAVALPWHSLYFDATRVRLVFYTLVS